MPNFTISGFGGMSASFSPKMLKENIATYSINCDTGDGRLRALRAPAVVSPNPLKSNPTTIYEYAPNQWFEFNADVDVARVPNAFDTSNKVVYTGDGYPRITRDDIAYSSTGAMPNGSYRLGLPAPTVAIFATVEGVPVENALDEYRSYVYTWVDAWGEESTTGPVSAIINVREGEYASLDIPSPPTGNYLFSSGSYVRVYRSNTGTSATAYQFVADIPMNTPDFEDTLSNAELGEVIPTISWVRPPDDVSADFPTGPMIGATTLPSGAIVGFSGKTLVYSEPYIPYAYPLEYRRTAKSDIVGVSPNSQGLVVLTTEKPHIAMGHDPQSVTLVELDEYQACVSKRSIVDMGESTIYASPDGLVQVTGASIQVVTTSIFTRDQWQELNPEEIHAYLHEGQYIGFTDTAAFVFDPNDQENAWTFLSIGADCAHHSALEDVLYLAEGAQLKRWGEGDKLTYSWTSKIFYSPNPMNFAAIRVACEGQVTVEIYADSVLVATILCTNDTISRLPAGFMANEWQIRLTGTADVDYVKLATSMQELNSLG